MAQERSVIFVVMMGGFSRGCRCGMWDEVGDGIHHNRTF